MFVHRLAYHHLSKMAKRVVLTHLGLWNNAINCAHDNFLGCEEGTCNACPTLLRHRDATNAQWGQPFFQGCAQVVRHCAGWTKLQALLDRDSNRHNIPIQTPESFPNTHPFQEQSKQIRPLLSSLQNSLGKSLISTQRKSSTVQICIWIACPDQGRRGALGAVGQERGLFSYKSWGKTVCCLFFP